RGAPGTLSGKVNLVGLFYNSTYARIVLVL
ncbi:MAG: hypothetical protein ACJAVF_003747, partial [Paraglaciecola sp.]